MKKSILALSLTRALAGALVLSSGASLAQSAAPAAADVGVAELDAVEVRGQIVFRDRAQEPATLVYDLEFFQPFEPLTVGDMLKRVPSVAFLSDVLE
nr:TonB-dependent receptor [Arenimonas sp.]